MKSEDIGDFAPKTYSTPTPTPPHNSSLVGIDGSEDSLGDPNWPYPSDNEAGLDDYGAGLVDNEPADASSPAPVALADISDEEERESDDGNEVESEDGDGNESEDGNEVDSGEGSEGDIDESADDNIGLGYYNDGHISMDI